MKKFISLLLALVICASVLTGISFAAEKPTECPVDMAAVVVTHAGDPTAKYYFDSLSNALIKWAIADLAGETTITLLKDIEVGTSSGTNIFTIPYTKSSWYGSNADANPLVLDLGGHTISCGTDQYMFKMTRYGMTVKNGTIDHSSSRSVFVLGTSDGPTAITDGKTQFKPKLNLENVTIYNKGTSTNSYVVMNYIFSSTINVTDSYLWAAKQAAIFTSKTAQTDMGSYKQSSKGVDTKINVSDSTIVSNGAYPITLASKLNLESDKVAISVKDTALVSGHASVANEATASVMNTNGQKAVVQENYSQFLKNGETATGTAHVYGVVKSEAKLPFTDVAESEWYYTYVRDLYNTKVISGMTETTFVPNGTLTYGQALKLITLAVGQPEQPAIEAHWASGYLNLALSNGWMYDEVALDSKISRLQFCQVAATAAGIAEQPASNPFKDTQDASVLALFNAGIINGMTADTFSPNSSLTRAQISKIIYGIISR